MEREILWQAVGTIRSEEFDLIFSHPSAKILDSNKLAALGRALSLQNIDFRDLIGKIFKTKELLPRLPRAPMDAEPWRHRLDADGILALLDC